MARGAYPSTLAHVGCASGSGGGVTAGLGLRLLPQPFEPMPGKPRTSPCLRERPFALDDLHDRILAQTEIAADQPIGKPIGMHAERLLGLPVRRTLAHLAPKFDAPGSSGCQAGLDPIPDQIALELSQAGHDGASACGCGAEIEAEARLSQNANFPAVQVVAGLEEVSSFFGSTYGRTKPPRKPTENLIKRQT